MARKENDSGMLFRQGLKSNFSSFPILSPMPKN
jgi:hypothetical protein